MDARNRNDHFESTTVIVMGQGTDADTVEEQVTKPIEKAVRKVASMQEQSILLS